jgi:stress response protein YsnF
LLLFTILWSGGCCNPWVEMPVGEIGKVGSSFRKFTAESTNLNNDKTSSPVSQKGSESPGSMYSKTEFLIPIKKEESVITKKSFVREELIVKKKPITETKTITEEITKEEVKYENEGTEKTKDKMIL